MKHNLTFAFIFSLISMFVVSESAFSKPFPKKLSLSYVEHPVVINDIIPVVKRAYQELGIQITLEISPSSRNLKALENRHVDGEVAYSDILFNKYPSVIKVGPPLATSVFVLLCRAETECESKLIFDDTTPVVVSSTIFRGLEDFYEEPLSQAFYKVDKLTMVLSLLNEGRFDYGIYVLSSEQKLLKEFDNLIAAELFRTHTYHVLHKRFSYIQDELSEALTRSLNIAKN